MRKGSAFPSLPQPFLPGKATPCQEGFLKELFSERQSLSLEFLHLQLNVLPTGANIERGFNAGRHLATQFASSLCTNSSGFPACECRRKRISPGRGVVQPSLGSTKGKKRACEAGDRAPYDTLCRQLRRLTSRVTQTPGSANNASPGATTLPPASAGWNPNFIPATATLPKNVETPGQSYALPRPSYGLDPSCYGTQQ